MVLSLVVSSEFFQRATNTGFRLGAGVALCVVIFFAGFYPHEWVMPFEKVKNGARIDTTGLVFSQPGLFEDDISPLWLAEVKSSNDFSIEILLSPALEQSLPQTTIIALATNRLDRSFAIEQDGNGLLVWLRNNANSLKGQSYFVENVFIDTEILYAINVRVDTDLFSVWVDGRLLVSEVLDGNALSFWADGHRLSIGNELTGERPWLGEIRRLSVFSASREYDLLHSDTFNIPIPMLLLKGAYFIQLVPFSLGISAAIVTDWLVNFIGFIPVGAFFALSLRRRKLLGAVLVSAFLSLSVEIGQLFISERTTQADDFILNTLGGMFGATLILLWYRLIGGGRNTAFKKNDEMA